MVKWREDVAFFYGLATVVSIVVAFFSLSPLWGMETTTITVVVLGLVLVTVGYVVFQTERARRLWGTSS